MECEKVEIKVTMEASGATGVSVKNCEPSLAVYLLEVAKKSIIEHSSIQVADVGPSK